MITVFYYHIICDRIVLKSRSKIFDTGKAGEEYLTKQVGGVSQVRKSTSYGDRIIDQLADAVAHESKAGCKYLDEFTKKQILKDAELITIGEIKDATWHFYKSGVTGKDGASKPLLDFLTEHVIKYIIE